MLNASVSISAMDPFNVMALHLCDVHHLVLKPTALLLAALQKERAQESNIPEFMPPNKTKRYPWHSYLSTLFLDLDVGP